ncbi:MAG: hypothetical protein ACPL3B_05065 [Fervidobacterium sp.]
MNDRELKFTYFGYLFFCLIIIYSYLSFIGFVPKVSSPILYVFLLIPIIFSYFKQIFRGEKLSKGEVLLWILILWIAVLHFIWFPIISAQVGVTEFLKNSVGTLLLTLLMLLIGFEFGRNYCKLITNVRYNKITLLVTIFFVCVIFLGVFLGEKNQGIFVLYFKNYQSDFEYNYQSIGDSFAILSLFALLQINNLYLETFVYVTSLIALFFSFSRTSFLLYTFFGGIFLVFDYKKSSKGLKKIFGRLTFLMLVASLVVLLVILSKNNSGQIQLVFRRMLLSFTSPSAWQARVEIFQKNLRVLADSWIFGEYMAEYIEFGPGGYVHNWLSFLVAYGIGPFFVFLVLTLMMLKKSLDIFVLYKQSFPLILFGFCLSAIIISRSYLWPYIWLSLGLTSTINLKGMDNEDCLSNTL